MSAYKLTIESATGMHGPIPIPPDFLADNPDPTPLEIAAEAARRMAEDHRAMTGEASTRLGFRAPLTIKVEDI